MRIRFTLILAITALVFAVCGSHAYALVTVSAPVIDCGDGYIDQTESSINVEISADCQVLNGSIDSAVAYLQRDSTSSYVILSSSGGNTYTGSTSLTCFGDYSVNVTCSAGSESGSAVTSFPVNQLDLEITSPTFSNPYEVYLSKPIDNVEVSFKLNGEPLTQADMPSFSAELISASSTYVLTELQKNYDSSIQRWVLSELPFSVTPGEYKLKIAGSYNGHSFYGTAINAVKIKPELSMNIAETSPQEPIKITDTIDVKITVDIMYRGDPLVDVYPSDFSSKIMATAGQSTWDYLDIKTSESSCDTNGRCTLFVNVPKSLLDPSIGSYDLHLSLSHEGNTAEISPLRVYYALPFKGTLTDISGNIVSAEIRLIYNQTEDLIRTGSSGEYYTTTPPGIYDIEMRFPHIRKVRLTDVPITSAVEDSIRYDSIPGSAPIVGISTAKFVVLEVALPFKWAQLEINYDSKKVSNEKKIGVYYCTNWNFDNRDCVGEWELIHASIDIVKDIVSFNTTHLSAFAVGERRALAVDGTLDKEIYFASSNAIFNGKVVDDFLEGIEGATVHYTAPHSNVTKTVTTGLGGLFKVEFITPDGEGLYKLEIDAEESPFISANQTYTFEVVRKKEVNLLVPEVMSVVLDYPTSFEFSVLNSGQTDLTNLRFYVTGISTKWYQVMPDAISKLAPGEEEKVILNTLITTDECKNDQCKKYYFANVEVKTDQGSSEVKPFTVKIDINDTSAVSAQTQNPKAGFSLGEITGNILSAVPSFSTSSNVIALVLVLIGFGVLRMKKKESVPRDRMEYNKGDYWNVFKRGKENTARKSAFPRSSVVSSLYNIKSEFKKGKE